MFSRPERRHAGWLTGCAVAPALAAACLGGCAEVTGLSAYAEATEAERLFSFDGDAELNSWSFEGCSHERSTQVGGQNPGSLRLSPAEEPCVAAAALSLKRPRNDYEQLAVWLRSESYDTITLGLDGVNNRVVICSPKTTMTPSGCTITPDQGNLGEGVLQVINLSDLRDAGAELARGEITRLTLLLPAAEAGTIALYVDDIWLR